MKKEALSFLHDSNASDDPKLIRLRLKYGWEAIGLYWALVERMRDNKGYKIKISDCDVIAVRLQPIKEIDIRELVDSCINEAISLFSSDGIYFWSDSLLDRMKKYDEWKKKKSEAGIKGNNARWGELRKKKEKGKSVAAGSKSDCTDVAANRREYNIKEDKIIEFKRIYNSDVYVNVAVEVIKYLNGKTGKKYELMDEYADMIVERQREGSKLEDFIHVIDVKMEDEHFKDNPHFMAPETLFRQPNFSRYRNQTKEDFKGKPKTPANSATKGDTDFSDIYD